MQSFSQAPMEQHQYLTAEQLDRLSIAELDYLILRGVPALVTEYSQFIDRFKIVYFWVELNRKKHCIVDWHAEDHFKAFITVSMLLAPGTEDLKEHFFKIYLCEAHQMSEPDYIPNSDQTSFLDALTAVVFNQSK